MVYATEDSMNIETTNLIKTITASITSILLAKAMSISAHDGEIIWTIAFAGMASFWAVGMWKWR